MDELIGKVLRTATICYSSEDEIENSDDNIEDTPDNSLIYSKQKNADFESGGRSIEAPLYSPLTPKPKLTAQANLNCLQNEEDLELGERSIEAPPYSPLTPKPKLTAQANLNCLQNKEDLELGERSIEAPPYSPLTPKPKLTARANFTCLQNKEEDKINKLINKPYTSRVTRSNSNKTYGTDVETCGLDNVIATNENNPFSPSSLILTREKNKKTYSRWSTRQTKQQLEKPSLVESPCHSINSELLELMDVVDSVDDNIHDILNNSDDSVKDPDYEEEDHDSDSTYCEDDIDDVTRSNLKKKQEKNMGKKRQVRTLQQIVLDSLNKPQEKNSNSQTIHGDNFETGEDLNKSDYSHIAQDDMRNNQLCENNNSSGFDLCEELEGPTGRPKKGRKRKYKNSKAETKQLKYNNLPYYNRKNQLIEPKIFNEYECSCKSKCGDKISVETRRREFNNFVQLGSYKAQALYIISHVQEVNKKRACTEQKDPKKARQFCRIYSLAGVKVCKEMFIHTLQISPQKVTVSLKKHRFEDTINDNRGAAVAGYNKIPLEEIIFAKNVIDRVPKYVSHYRRNTTNANFLPPGTTLTSLYDLYKREFEKLSNNNRTVLSFSSFKKIFYENFNLKFKTLKKDTCNKCDKFAVAKERLNDMDLSENQAIDGKHADHLRLAEMLRNQMNNDFMRAKTEKELECITFDLEKTLPLPRIPTNLVFYKRQLWVYNSGIHVASNDIGYCYVWIEGEAGRGAQEVGSCLLSHINNELRPEVVHLITWSDSCGGQNRNIKLILMLKAVLHTHPTLKTIRCRYLEPGHSFLPNDTDFSKIELRLKQHERLYTVEDYMRVMENCKKKNPLKVVRMKSHNFLGTGKIEKGIINRKVCEQKNTVSWLATKEILLKKEDNHLIYMRKNFEDEYQIINLKKTRGRSIDINEEGLIPLWPQGKEIAEKKLNDIRSLFDYIPVDARPFYETLKGNRESEDDVEGFGGTPDFPLFYSDEE